MTCCISRSLGEGHGGDAGAPAVASRDVFVFMINGAKERAPAAAMGVIAALGA